MADVTRRGLIGSFAALAALAVVPGTARALSETDQAKLVRQMREQKIVTGQYFIISDTVVFDDLRDVMLDRCVIEASADFPLGRDMILVHPNCTGLEMRYCCIEGNGRSRHALTQLTGERLC